MRIEKRLEHPLFKLVEIRASQINGCAYCLDMHTKDARAAGETEQRIYALERLARDTVLHRSRARRARVDGSRDAGGAKRACPTTSTSA